MCEVKDRHLTQNAASKIEGKSTLADYKARKREASQSIRVRAMSRLDRVIVQGDFFARSKFGRWTKNLSLMIRVDEFSRESDKNPLIYHWIHPGTR